MHLGFVWFHRPHISPATDVSYYSMAHCNWRTLVSSIAWRIVGPFLVSHSPFGRLRSLYWRRLWSAKPLPSHRNSHFRSDQCRLTPIDSSSAHESCSSLRIRRHWTNDPTICWAPCSLLARMIRLLTSCCEEHRLWLSNDSITKWIRKLNTYRRFYPFLVTKRNWNVCLHASDDEPPNLTSQNDNIQIACSWQLWWIARRTQCVRGGRNQLDLVGYRCRFVPALIREKIDCERANIVLIRFKLNFIWKKKSFKYEASATKGHSVPLIFAPWVMSGEYASECMELYFPFHFTCRRSKNKNKNTLYRNIR